MQSSDCFKFDYNTQRLVDRKELYKVAETSTTKVESMKDDLEIKPRNRFRQHGLIKQRFIPTKTERPKDEENEAMFRSVDALLSQPDYVEISNRKLDKLAPDFRYVTPLSGSAEIESWTKDSKTSESLQLKLKPAMNNNDVPTASVTAKHSVKPSSKGLISLECGPSTNHEGMSRISGHSSLLSNHKIPLKSRFDAPMIEHKGPMKIKYESSIKPTQRPRMLRNATQKQISRLSKALETLSKSPVS